VSTRKRTTEEITKANLSKTLNKLKVSVAEREEIWAEFFELLLPLMNEELMGRIKPEDIDKCARLSDECLRVYEDRWGKASQ
jgi:nitrate reductase assembly molybdenum cofactor insertion protein NarJ